LLVARTIGEALRDLRHERGISQHDLQRATGVHFTQISAIERGLRPNPTLEILVRLAQGLDITPAELVSRVSYDDGEPLSPRAKVRAKRHRE
jgi:transcriptional regulator with XRE-family HTH domain